MWRIMFLFLVALSGFFLGTLPPVKRNVHPETPFPIVEHKSFVVVIYAYNQALWCERALRSVFEQDYDHYRLMIIDDGSIDGTTEKVRQFVVDNNQESKVILIRNETRFGQSACLARAIDSCLDREIIVPLDANNWFSSPIVFNHLNTLYQNPDVWIAFGQGIDYPSYDIQDEVQLSYYASLFKQNGASLLEAAEGRIRKLQEPLVFLNGTGG